jgi:hypothetical protein
MADNYQPTSKSIAQTADPQRVLPDGTSGIIPICRNPAGGGEGEGNCPLWDGHIIDASFPLV